jgi:hypothetical protein
MLHKESKQERKRFWQTTKSTEVEGKHGNLKTGRWKPPAAISLGTRPIFIIFKSMASRLWKLEHSDLPGPHSSRKADTNKLFSRILHQFNVWIYVEPIDYESGLNFNGTLQTVPPSPIQRFDGTAIYSPIKIGKGRPVGGGWWWRGGGSNFTHISILLQPLFLYNEEISNSLSYVMLSLSNNLNVGQWCFN